MRLLKDNKGQLRVIEAFFASVLLLSSLTLIPTLQRTSDNSNDSTAVLSSTALDVLRSLDNDGNLASLVDNRSWTTIKSSIQSCVPLTVWFNLTVFNENMTILNDIPLCSGNAVSDNIASADYICSSLGRNYAVYVLRLQLAVVD